MMSRLWSLNNPCSNEERLKHLLLHDWTRKVSRCNANVEWRHVHKLLFQGCIAMFLWQRCDRWGFSPVALPSFWVRLPESAPGCASLSLVSLPAGPLALSPSFLPFKSVPCSSASCSSCSTCNNVGGVNCVGESCEVGCCGCRSLDEIVSCGRA